MISRASVFCNRCGTAVANADVAAASPLHEVTMPPSLYVPDPKVSPVVAGSMSLRHSGAGIASFVIACVSFVNCIITGGGLLVNSDYQSFDGAMEILYLLFMMGVGLLLIGVSMGIIGVVQSNRNKLFGILGLVFNSIMLFPVIVFAGFFIFSTPN